MPEGEETVTEELVVPGFLSRTKICPFMQNAGFIKL